MKRKEIQVGQYILVTIGRDDRGSGNDFTGEILERIVSVEGDTVQTYCVTDETPNTTASIDEFLDDDVRAVDHDLAERIWRAMLTFSHTRMEDAASTMVTSFGCGKESVDLHAEDR